MKNAVIAAIVAAVVATGAAGASRGHSAWWYFKHAHFQQKAVTVSVSEGNETLVGPGATVTVTATCLKGTATGGGADGAGEIQSSNPVLQPSGWEATVTNNTQSAFYSRAWAVCLA